MRCARFTSTFLIVALAFGTFGLVSASSRTGMAATWETFPSFLRHPLLSSSTDNLPATFSAPSFPFEITSPLQVNGFQTGNLFQSPADPQFSSTGFFGQKDLVTYSTTSITLGKIAELAESLLLSKIETVLLEKQVEEQSPPAQTTSTDLETISPDTQEESSLSGDTDLSVESEIASQNIPLPTNTSKLESVLKIITGENDDEVIWGAGSLLFFDTSFFDPSEDVSEIADTLSTSEYSDQPSEYETTTPTPPSEPKMNEMDSTPDTTTLQPNEISMELPDFVTPWSFDFESNYLYSPRNDLLFACRNRGFVHPENRGNDDARFHFAQSSHLRDAREIAMEKLVDEQVEAKTETSKKPLSLVFGFLSDDFFSFVPFLQQSSLPIDLGYAEEAILKKYGNNENPPTTQETTVSTTTSSDPTETNPTAQSKTTPAIPTQSGNTSSNGISESNAFLKYYLGFDLFNPPLSEQFTSTGTTTFDIPTSSPTPSENETSTPSEDESSTSSEEEETAPPASTGESLSTDPSLSISSSLFENVASENIRGFVGEASPSDLSLLAGCLPLWVGGSHTASTTTNPSEEWTLFKNAWQTTQSTLDRLSHWLQERSPRVSRTLKGLTTQFCVFNELF